MRAVIVGGGKVGSYLARELRRERHSVIVIEENARRAEQVAEDTGALTMHGDGTDLRLLNQLEVRRTDLLLAVTGVDETNLVACQLARTAFEVERVLARLNDPRNRPTFDALEIPVVSVTDVMVKVISRELDLAELVRVALLGRGEVSLFEIEVPDDLAPRRLEQIRLPPSSVLVAIRRAGTVLVPHGDSEVRPGDRVLAVTLVELEDEVRDCLLGRLDPDEVETPEGSPLRIDGE